MNRRATIDLEMGEVLLPVYVAEQTTEVSEYTGRVLTVLRGEAHATGADADEAFHTALTEVERSGARSRASVTYGPPKLWQVTREDYSITGDRYRYSLTLREREERSLASLQLGDLHLEPTRYEESISRGELSAQAAVVVSDEIRDRLLKLMRTGGYFAVIRHGINETPVEMRFGMCGWSTHPEGTKYRLILVDKRADFRDGEREKEHIVNAERRNKSNALAASLVLLEELSDLLVAKGILTAAEIDAIRERADERLSTRIEQFLKVEDADELSW